AALAGGEAPGVWFTPERRPAAHGAAATPGPVPAPASGPVPAPASGPVPAPASGPVPAPASGPVPAPASGPVPAPASGPVPAPASGPVPAPDARPASQALPVPDTVPRHDLTAAFGRASGALGVLQCAAAVGWFAAGGRGRALLTAGDDTADAVAGLLLAP
ncbi:hypothetical protein RKE29_30395, partial [Streptomyces sp. B1866]|nr:hypothetical protein [Streptomyces sp. B1866]